MKMKFKIMSRSVSFLMALTLVFSLLPAGILSMKTSAAPAADIGISYTDPEGWGTVYGYVWEIGTENPDWPGEKLSTDDNGYYFLDLSAYKGKEVGVIFNVGSDAVQTADLKLPLLQSGDRFWCASSNKNEEPVATYRTYAPGAGPRVTVHFNANAAGWGNVNGYSWFLRGEEAEKPTGEWPGKSLSENSTNPGWYDLILMDFPVNTLGVIFNQDGGAQTGDIVLDLKGGETEYWVNGANAQPTTLAPSGWKSGYSVTVHYYNALNWQTVHNYAWDNDGRNDYCDYWPGKQVSEDPDHFGWYTMTVSNVQSNDLHCIFNNGTGGDGNQTDNISIHDLKAADTDGDRKVEFWYCNSTMTNTAPQQWNAGYAHDGARQFYVPGTFPGAGEWLANSNGMSYTGSNGVYRYTFTNVPAGTYSFKIAVNGAWTENYGVNGVADGMNYKVTLDRAGDVTVWYSDLSHVAQTSVSYEYGRNVTLSGGGIGSVRMYDHRLTGVYSTTVNLPKGSHSGIQISAGGKTYAFNPINLSEPKAVTFFVDPATGAYYQNAGGDPIDSSKVYYTTKESTYKSVMGAVPNTAATTFCIQTGSDVRQVELIVGREADILLHVPMTAANGDDGTTLWSCNPDFSGCTIADNYWYYFALRNESGDRKLYSDDVGDWGTGKLVPDGMEWSYNLVIHKNGFQTPDWLKDAVIYQIFPDRFFNGDASNDRAQTSARGDVDYEFPAWDKLPENPSLITRPDYPNTAFKGDGQYSNEIYGGDLKGITEKIEYLKALGVTVIYLNPVFSSISNHRYDACDYMAIDPILGTLGDFEEMVAAAEANGMHIILDGVFNHVSDDSVYFDRYYKFLGKSEKIGAYPYWAYVYDLINDHGYGYEAAKTEAKRYFTTKYGITDFSYTEWFKINNEKCSYSDTIGDRAGKKVYSYEGWWGYDSMPVIYSTNGSEYQTGNWAEEIIYNAEGTSVTQYWIAKGSDGWRLDVANEVSNETWQRFRESVKAMNSSTVTVLGDGSTTYDDENDAAIVGEIWSDAAYYLLGDMYDSVMNYLFRDAAAGFARTYRINRDNKYEKLDSDYTAWDALNTLEATRERYPQEAFYAMMNLVGSHDTARILSYLDHVEDDGWSNENMANAYPTYAGTSQQAKKLQYMVALIQFTYPGAPTIYYGDEIGMVGSDDPDDRRAFEWGKGNKELVEWYALLAQIRNQYQALRTGSLEPFAPNRDVMGYVRRGTDGSFVIMANRLGSAQSVTVDLESLGVGSESVLTDLLTGTQFHVSGGMVTITVPACGGVILKVGTAEKQTLSAEKIAALRPAYDTSYVEETQKWTVTYSWTGAPEGVKLPASVFVKDGGACNVDTAYTAATVIEQKNEAGKVTGRWFFSGWSRSGRLTVTGDIAITGSWRFEKVTPPSGFDVTYVWGDGPSGLVLPGQKDIPAGTEHKVDEAYTSATVIEVKNAQGTVVGKWTFSGWDQSGTITVNADVIITGSWKYEALTEDEWQVTYEWTNAPEGVTLPQGGTVINGKQFAVDTNYTAVSIIEETDADGNVTGRWIFSGWSKTGTITVTGDLVITGTWRYETVVIGTTPPPTEDTNDTTGPSQGTTDSGSEQKPTIPAGTDAPSEPKPAVKWWIVVAIGVAMALAGAGGGWFFWYSKRKKEDPTAQ